ncbi:hypothetical protein NQZ68_025848 [Dissostichus eleginoides]|nr:hypothetical protein NQZ68_025848 [Dissostichus eleginoides]
MAGVKGASLRQNSSSLWLRWLSEEPPACTGWADVTFRCPARPSFELEEEIMTWLTLLVGGTLCA